MTDTTRTTESTVTDSPLGETENAEKREKVKSSTFQKMLDILNGLLDHDHYYEDIYGTACQCECQCNCQCRGIW